MRFFPVFILAVIHLTFTQAWAQEADTVRVDSLVLSIDTIHPVINSIEDSVYNITDSIVGIQFLQKKDTIALAPIEPKSEFKPNSKKAVIYAAIFPGLGQIYNRKYWKLPLVYGGFLGCAYAITWNGEQYNGYKQAYKDILPSDGKEHSGDSWREYVPFNMGSPDDLIPSQITWLTNGLKSKRDFYRRNRDLSIIVTVGVYAISIIDAYVDAQLFDFDISPDLSLRVEPVLYQKSPFNTTSAGLQCSFNF